MNSNMLKLIACLCMLVDHIGRILLDDNIICTSIGRLAFPIFAYLLVEGLKNTRDIRKYIARLLVFAVISEVPFNLAISGKILYPYHQNVFFTLALGLAVISCFEEKSPYRNMAGAALLISCILAVVCKLDYNCAGILFIVSFYVFNPNRAGTDVRRRLKLNSMLLLVNGLISILFIGISQLVSLASLVPINMYNGKRGRLKLKYFFYAFYPFHLLVLWWIKYYRA